jgi:pyruvate-formate lyase-activating enzyme
VNFYELHRSRFGTPVGLEPLPTFLELYFSNACDLKCIYCNNQFSSQWEAELRKYGEPFETLKDDTNGLLKQRFYEWFEKEGCASILTYDILGGEPTIQNDFYEFTDYLIDTLSRIPNQHSIKPEICITTNGNTPERYIGKFMDTLDKLSNHMSIRIDFSNGSVGQRAEFVRTNLDWNIFERNVRRISEFSKGKDIRVRFNCAHTAITVPTFIDFLKWAHEIKTEYDIKITFATNTVVQPSNLSPWNLTEDFKANVQECIDWINTDAPEWQDYIKYLESLKNGIGKYNLEDLKTIPHWAEQMRTRRGLDLLETFPELRNWYEFCCEIAAKEK